MGRPQLKASHQKHRSWQLYSNEKNGLQQFQMESCQPIKRLRDKKKKMMSAEHDSVGTWQIWSSLFTNRIWNPQLLHVIEDAVVALNSRRNPLEFCDYNIYLSRCQHCSVGSSYFPLWPNSFNRLVTCSIFQSFLTGWWMCAQWKSEEFTEYNIWLGAPPANSSSVLFKKIKINISQSCLTCWSKMMKCMSLFCLNNELYP